MFCRFLLGILILLGIAGLSVGAGPRGELAREQHPWGRFEPGSWKTVRVDTEIFQGDGTVTSSTETKTTLQSADDTGVTLLVEVTIEMGGQRHTVKPQVVRQDFFGQIIVEGQRRSTLDDTAVSLQGREIPCRVALLEHATETALMRTKVFYSDSVEPYVLRRESAKIDLASHAKVAEMTDTVVAVGVPCKILNRMGVSSHVKTVYTHTTGTTTKTTLICSDLPGGVVSQTSEDVNGDGRLVRRSSLQLVDFAATTKTERSGRFGRRAARRSR